MQLSLWEGKKNSPTWVKEQIFFVLSNLGSTGTIFIRVFFFSFFFSPLNSHYELWSPHDSVSRCRRHCSFHPFSQLSYKLGSVLLLGDKVRGVACSVACPLEGGTSVPCRCHSAPRKCMHPCHADGGSVGSLPCHPEAVRSFLLHLPSSSAC